MLMRDLKTVQYKLKEKNKKTEKKNWNTQSLTNQIEY